jgi:hypothetical protein
MKRSKEQPSLLGLLLLVGGMLLLSIVVFSLASPGNTTDGKFLLGLGGASVVSLIAGATLSGRKRPRPHRPH